MTLKELFYKNIPLDDFSGKYSTFMKHASNCEKISDDFAIEFTEWVSDTHYCQIPNNNWIDNIEYSREGIKKCKQITSKELLQIFKKERGYE